MSQFNAVQHTLQNRGTTRQRNAAPRIPRQGIQRRLNAPGLAVPRPVVSKGARMAQDLLQSLGIAGQAANTVTAYTRQQIHQIERENAKIEDQYRGQASLDVRTRLPQIVQAIKDRNITVPDGMSVGDYAQQLIDQQLVDEDGNPIVPKAYADQYRRTLQPQLAAAFEDQQQAIIGEQRQESLQLTQEGIATAGDAKSIARFADAAQERFDLSDTERSRLIVPALRTAAAAGDRQKFDAAAEALNGRLPGLVRRARLQLDSQFRQNDALAERDRARVFDQGLADKLNVDGPINFDGVRDYIEQQAPDPVTKRAALDDVARREDHANADLENQALDQLAGLQNAGVPFDKQREFIKQDTRIDPQKKHTLYRQVDSAEAMRQHEQQRQRIKAGVDRAKSLAENRVRVMLNMGTGPMVPDIQYTDAAGDVHTFDRGTLVKQAVDQKMMQIAESAGSEDQALAQQVQYLSRNGVTYDVYHRIMEAGPLAVMSDLTATADAKPDQLPKSLITGFDLYKRMGTMNPRLRDAHVGGRAAKFYQYAELAEKYITPGDTPSALLYAARAMARQQDIGGQQSTITDKELQVALDKVGFIDGWFHNTYARNTAEIGGQIKNLARLYVNATGINASDAITEAAQKIKQTHTIVNGWMIDTHGRHVPANMDGLAKQIATSYVEKHGKDEGVEASDLTLIPGETDASWILFNENTLTPVEHWRDEGMYTTADLTGILEHAKMKRRAEAKQAALDNWDDQGGVSVHDPGVPVVDLPRRFMMVQPGGTASWVGMEHYRNPGQLKRIREQIQRERAAEWERVLRLSRQQDQEAKQ